MPTHLVRFGSLSWIGVFDSSLPVQHPVDTEVVCQTSRGLEVGRVIAACGSYGDWPATGTILRALGATDQLLWQRLESYRHRALAGCESRLRERNIAATLLDAELTFDGQHLFFYFLGEPPAELDEIAAELSEVYQTKIHYRRFAERLAQGCGPDCGTKDNGCGSSGCGSCAVRGGCARG